MSDNISFINFIIYVSTFDFIRKMVISHREIVNSTLIEFTHAWYQRDDHPPSIEEALNHFKNQNIYKILVLPLYPQAGSPTNSSTFDEISRVLNGWPWLPNLRFVNGYHDDEDYILAISRSIKKSTSDCKNIEKIIFSFHIANPVVVRHVHHGLWMVQQSDDKFLSHFN